MEQKYTRTMMQFSTRLMRNSSEYANMKTSLAGSLQGACVVLVVFGFILKIVQVVKLVAGTGDGIYISKKIKKIKIYLFVYLNTDFTHSDLRIQKKAQKYLIII